MRSWAIISVLLILSLLAAGWAAQPRAGGADFGGTTHVFSNEDAALAKLHPLIRDSAKTAPGSAIMVHIYAMADANVNSIVPDAIRRSYVMPNGMTIFSGTVTARALPKLASLEGVIGVEPMQGAYEPDIDPELTTKADADPSPELAAMMTAAFQSGDRVLNAEPQAPDVQPNGWADVLNTHNTELAWDKGYTGAGVKVMVNDSSVDFAHPDLFGTWAMVDDPSSPYAGWPMMFDAFSMFLMARDLILGEANIANGQAYYSDTSAVVTAANPSYQPVDMDEMQRYTLTGTSQSGEYHIGTHPDRSLAQWYFIATGNEPAGEDDPGRRPAILLVDEQQAGVYDTVYVDLNFNNDFSDDPTMTKENPVACLDLWGDLGGVGNPTDPSGPLPPPDGFCDVSAGLVYFIADGTNPVPGFDWFWGIGVAGNGTADEGEPLNGSLVAFTVQDYVRSPFGNHGMLVSSGMVAQGNIDGDSFDHVLGIEEFAGVGGVRPDYKPEDSGGMVFGAGRDAKLVSAGDFSMIGGVDAFVLGMLGYDGIPGTGDDVQIINNSWGQPSGLDDGWDVFSRTLDLLNRGVNPQFLIVFSAGNGGPGYGTVTPPSPMTGITVGASTQYGSTGWDSASGADQITYGDAAAFTARGPGARGDNAIDIMGSGSRASGAVPLSEAMSGANAWTTWGGTSRSGPVVAGHAALVYQAYFETYGTWPDYEIARSILMSGAQDMHYDTLIQGAGAVDGNRAVDIASGAAGTFVWPSTWEAGGYQGQQAPGFTNVVLPGESSEQWFYITNPSDTPLNLTVGDQWLQKIGTWEEEWTSADISQEPISVVEGQPESTSYDWNAPHYLWNVTDLIPADADLVVFRQAYTWDYYDPGNAYRWEAVNDWYMMAFDHKDVNGNGLLWEDRNGNGVVNPDEIDQGEYMRYDYANQRANTGFLTIQRPLERMHDDFYIGLMHNQARADIPQTPMIIGMDFYKQVDAPWMSVGSTAVGVDGEVTRELEAEQVQFSIGAGETKRVLARVDIPGDAPIGVYEGALWVSDGYWKSIVPVTVNVAAKSHAFSTGGDLGDGFYSNGKIYGAQSWRGSAEGGDWRFFSAVLEDEPGVLLDRVPGGDLYYMVEAAWDQLPTTVGLHVLSPFLDQFSTEEPGYYGPYTLAESAASNDTLIGEGIYRAATSSGGNREFIGGPYVPGLNMVLAHNRSFAGVTPAENLHITTGALVVSDAQLEITHSLAQGGVISAQQAVASSMPLSGLVVQGFGMSNPIVETGVPVTQEDPNDPSTAAYQHPLTLEHAGVLQVDVVGQEADDLDLFVLYDANGDGQFDWGSELVASSTTATAVESITIQLPPDGEYLVVVHGWAVPAAESTFDIQINAVQGDDVTTSNLPEGAISPNRVYDFNFELNVEGYAPGLYFGLVTLGPPEGPTAAIITLAVEITE